MKTSRPSRPSRLANDALRLSPFQTRRLQSEKSWSRKSSSVSLLQQKALSSVQLLCATSGLISVNFRLETWLQGLWCLWFDLGTQVSEKGVKNKSTHTSVDSEEAWCVPSMDSGMGSMGFSEPVEWTNPIASISIPNNPIQGYLVLNRKPKQSGLCNFATLQKPEIAMCFLFAVAGGSQHLLNEYQTFSITANTCVHGRIDQQSWRQTLNKNGQPWKALLILAAWSMVASKNGKTTNLQCEQNSIFCFVKLRSCL